MQQQNVAPAQVAMHVQALMLDSDVVLDKTKTFYACKETFGGMHNVGKDDFGLIFDRVQIEVDKPLTKASYHLAKQEAELKQKLIDSVYQVEPDDPDHCRRLMGTATKIRSERSAVFLEGIHEAVIVAFNQSLIDEPLIDEVISCWPDKFKGFEYGRN